jgi:hypothetical protein
MTQGMNMKMGGPPPSMDTRPQQRGPIPQGPARPLSSGPSQQPMMRGPSGLANDLLKELETKSSRGDEDSMSESSYNIQSFGKKGTIKKSKRGGIELSM